MKDEIKSFRESVDDNRFLHEGYFIILSVILAFGILQTLGAGLGTEKPVVTVISTSMCPALQVGDILVVQNQPFEQIQQNDIIVYDVPDRAEFTVNGEAFTVEAPEGPSEVVETEIGDVQLVEVHASSDRSRDSAIFKLNGSVIQSNGADASLVEGNSYDFPGGTMHIDYLTSLPYGDVPIVHRVIEKNEDHVQTIGDNNEGQLEFESHVRDDQIHGKVAFRIPYMGLLKIGLMDFTGYSGGQPFVFDSTPACG